LHSVICPYFKFPNFKKYQHDDFPRIHRYTGRSMKAPEEEYGYPPPPNPPPKWVEVGRGVVTEPSRSRHQKQQTGGGQVQNAAQTRGREAAIPAAFPAPRVAPRQPPPPSPPDGGDVPVPVRGWAPRELQDRERRAAPAPRRPRPPPRPPDPRSPPLLGASDKSMLTLS